MEKLKIETSKYLYENHDLLWSEDAQEFVTTDILMELSGLTREELLSVFKLVITNQPNK